MSSLSPPFFFLDELVREDTVIPPAFSPPSKCLLVPPRGTAVTRCFVDVVEEFIPPLFHQPHEKHGAQV